MNGRQKGKKSVEDFKAYWNELREQNQYLPIKPDGEVWLGKVAAEVGFNRQALRTNPELKKLFDEACEETYAAAGATPPASQQRTASITEATDENVRKLLEVKDRAISTLQKKNGELAAANDLLQNEVNELKTRLAAANASSLVEDLLVASGRTILPV